MRTKEFEFKKTIKRVKKFKAISIDLTVSEAQLLYDLLYDADAREPETVEEEAIDVLVGRLNAFIDKNTVVPF